MELATNQDQDKSKIEIRKLDRKALFIGVFGLIVLFVFPIIATQCNMWFDFANTGQIGDTIGGLTAPVIGFFSALLIYLSFRAQIIANMKIQKQIDDQKKDELEKKEFNYQMEIYKQLKESLEQFQYYISGGEVEGCVAIHKFLGDYFGGRGMHYSTSNISFDGILRLFEILIDKIEISYNKNVDINLVLTLVEHQFNQYIWESIKNKDNKRTKIILSQEPTIDIISSKISSINNRLISLRKI